MRIGLVVMVILGNLLAGALGQELHGSSAPQGFPREALGSSRLLAPLLELPKSRQRNFLNGTLASVERWTSILASSHLLQPVILPLRLRYFIRLPVSPAIQCTP